MGALMNCLNISIYIFNIAFHFTYWTKNDYDISFFLSLYLSNWFPILCIATVMLYILCSLSPRIMKINCQFDPNIYENLRSSLKKNEIGHLCQCADADYKANAYSD